MADRVIKCTALAMMLLATQVSATGRISNIQVRDGQMSIRVETTAGQSYQTQCTTNLSGRIWENLGNEFVAVTNFTKLSFPQQALRCFLRVVKTDTAETTEEPPPPDEEPPPPPVAP